MWRANACNSLANEHARHLRFSVKLISLQKSPEDLPCRAAIQRLVGRFPVLVAMTRALSHTETSGCHCGDFWTHGTGVFTDQARGGARGVNVDTWSVWVRTPGHVGGYQRSIEPGLE